jgi:hypothetical protein
MPPPEKRNCLQIKWKKSFYLWIHSFKTLPSNSIGVYGAYAWTCVMVFILDIFTILDICVGSLWCSYYRTIGRSSRHYLHNRNTAACSLFESSATLNFVLEHEIKWLPGERNFCMITRNQVKNAQKNYIILVNSSMNFFRTRNNKKIHSQQKFWHLTVIWFERHKFKS